MTRFKDKILSSSRERGSRLVLALDVYGSLKSRLDRAGRILEQTKHLVAAVKLNHHLILPYGLEGLRGIIEECKSAGLPLIADLKLNDTEATNIDALESLAQYGFDAVIANPFVGYEEGLGKIIERAHVSGFGILLLVYMSHRGAGEYYSLFAEGGEPVYRMFAKGANLWGVDGVVVSARSGDKIAEVRSIVGRECMIFSPGVGVQGGTASEAISAGADFVIVGRAITEAEEPARAISLLE